jgi:hypothetical protein
MPVTLQQGHHTQWGLVACFGQGHDQRAAGGRFTTREGMMAGISSKSLDSPDEQRNVGRGVLDVVNLEGASAARIKADHGWRWSEDVKPIVGGDSCQTAHLGYVLSGSIRIAADDGTEVDLRSGDAYTIAPGHDAWVTSDEPFEALEFQSQTAQQYAKGAST